MSSIKRIHNAKSPNKRKVSTGRDTTLLGDRNKENGWHKEFNSFFTIVGIILCASMIAAFLASVSSAEYSSGLKTFKEKVELIKDYISAAGLFFSFDKQSIEMTFLNSNKSIATESDNLINTNKSGSTTDSKGVESDYPTFKAYIPLWGLVGSSSYVFVTTAKYIKNGKFQRRYIPEQISRLVIGPAIAVVVFYVLSTGSFFGLSFDITKIASGVSPAYVYAAVSFFVGYTTRGAIRTFSGIINTIFRMDDEEDDLEIIKSKKKA
jgi:hypothetical protein